MKNYRIVRRRDGKYYPQFKSEGRIGVPYRSVLSCFTGWFCDEEQAREFISRIEDNIDEENPIEEIIDI